MDNQPENKEDANFFGQILEEIKRRQKELSELVQKHSQIPNRENETLSKSEEIIDEYGHIVNRTKQALDDLKAIAMSISPNRRQTFPCALPFHDLQHHASHICYSGKVKGCQANPQHIFCESHDLKVCPCCGGDFK